MTLNDYFINVLASIIAVDYMDYGFRKKYAGIKRWILFVAGCSVYFFVVTGINSFINYEGILCVLYGGVLTLLASGDFRHSESD